MQQMENLGCRTKRHEEQCRLVRLISFMARLTTIELVMRRAWWLFFVYLVTICYISLDAYKILIYNPRFGKSHVRFMGTVADTIAEAGHEVIQLMPIMNSLINTNASRLAKTVTIPPHPELVKFSTDTRFITDGWKLKQRNPIHMLHFSTAMAEAFTIGCEHLLKHKEILDQLKAEKFDLAITEVFDACPIGLIELLQIPAHVFVSPSGIFEYLAAAVGMPNFPSYVPSAFASFTEEMTYFQRVLNLIFFFVSNNFVDQIVSQQQALFRRLYGEEFIDFNEKIAQATYFLTNADPFFDFPKPTIHKVKEIGGLSVPKVKPLNKHWTRVMNQRKKVILVSFGSVIESYLMPNETKRAFLETFDQFPDVTFIWKYEKEEHRIDDGHPNVVTGTWLPQTDLLAHPNLVAFLTHGGMNSITETLSRGKPVLVVPIFGDQMRNGVLAERFGFGIMLNVPDLAVEGKLRDAFERIINDENYAQKAQQLSKMIAKRPNPAKEQLIKHVEFAAEFGQIPNFDPYGRKMSFISYYMLDIILPFLLLVLLIAVGLCYGVFRLFRRLILRSSEGSNNEEKEAKKNK